MALDATSFGVHGPVIYWNQDVFLTFKHPLEALSTGIIEPSHLDGFNDQVNARIQHVQLLILVLGDMVVRQGQELLRGDVGDEGPWAREEVLKLVRVVIFLQRLVHALRMENLLLGTLIPDLVDANLVAIDLPSGLFLVRFLIHLVYRYL